MNSSIFWQIIALFFWVIAFALLFIKYRHTINARQQHNREIGHKWIGWYHQLKIQGTSSQRYRRFMQESNRINTAIWLAIFIGFIFILIYKYGRYLN